MSIITLVEKGAKPFVAKTKQLRERLRDRSKRKRRHEIVSILSSGRGPDTSRAELQFSALQEAFPKRPEYGYDPLSLFERAASRAPTLLRSLTSCEQRPRVLEVGAGDGMLGALLAAARCDVVLSDMEDWRCDSAKALEFVSADASALPFEDKQFDMVCSYNSFEHFSDPLAAFNEALRVAKIGGVLHFEFGPLYCSAWGLHAYRSLRMPYPQFLFSENFIEAKLSELGIWDLGEQRTELQNLNKWRPAQFESLWNRGDCSIVQCRRICDDSHAEVILQFPDSFIGRGLSYDDVTCSAFSVTVRRVQQ